MESKKRSIIQLMLVALVLTCYLLYRIAHITVLRVLPCSCPHNDSSITTKKQLIDTSSLAYISGRPSVHPFREDYVQCHSLVYSDQSDVELHRTRVNASSDKCTPQHFQSYFEENNRFYSGGTWLIPDEESPEGAQFFPDHCVFDETQTQPGKLGICLKKRELKKILVYGDSNGLMLFEQMLEFFQSHSAGCEQLRIEEEFTLKTPSAYLQVPGSPPVQKFKGCIICYSQIYECHNVDSIQGYTVSIEYIGTAFMINKKIKNFSSEELLRNRVLDEDSVIEYLLQIYLPYHGFPDLFIVPAMIHHEVHKSTYEEFEKDLRDFSLLLDTYLPTKTDLVLLTNIRMCPMLLGMASTQEFWQEFKLAKNKMMHVMNQIVFDVFKDKLVSPDSNVHGFLDMGDLTCPIVCNWHKDGSHMVDPFYKYMDELILQYLCAE